MPPSALQEWSAAPILVTFLPSVCEGQTAHISLLMTHWDNFSQAEDC